jgi:hypothetical protein
MTYHVCPDCGLGHDHVVPAVNSEVEIARIQAESALAIARLQAKTDAHVAEVEAESAVDVAEAEAEVIATVFAEETAEVAEDAEAEEPAEGMAPVMVFQDQDVEAPEVPAPPVAEEPEHRETPRKRGLGFW